MKWLCSFLAILVLFLSVQPACGVGTRAAVEDACCETDAASNDACGDDQEHQHDDGCKGCNPFHANCSCCIIAALLPQNTVAVTFPLPSFDTPVWGERVISLQEATVSDFWQPPRAA